ncbi:UDP-N-acetylmuramoyl-L-alanyl-D-glutamate--2,6-diaminopimelate ligase [Haematobacter massiliensis]|uniref:UDP-N-acetylmuramoyl-L-alanyl-D-glutamate--2,6-diaminopimelate ligase n=1 Tax=Haematobacter massiliensis TaxID=195105 RepID=A0A086Y7L7_9RHOB|nr:UDP-N-acetylmuramoyl-L-alanyl-D-glutamate--2,6-diaminopimelate ligase [Haematobacter massiliensis]KFI30267.1 UDP-N-acetylmuramoylalanyl-D-glutamate--2,6-diaminopimelate ligase [Haematobacter massiliensis]OWJ70581.1 UDP-N-acetylmuramoyl-L-alanyl-D-glutamate--2,6-diaminopimelate ligase [Haematobacter massiliensis]OWJ87279.1 UDP-N-acetylmuramoyl-L-alanyl-D-glutamate--2,6-diaminopimelate ligase [Haematobacter massiliensis]QBJ24729.1 UDP-N-acetylmuramoyl-L-alanyl-D-glutamate--2,6-diaminopimelate 
MPETTKSLSDLGLRARDGRETRITGLSVDSRTVKPGHLFAALAGAKMHGAEFIPYALRMKAGAVLTDPAGAEMAREVLTGTDIPVIVVEDARAALAGAAALWFGAQPQVMVAVTGTNGKTSVATFTRQIWTRLGHLAANIGTTGVEGAFVAPATHTTPEPLTLHRLLAEMAAEGITHAAMEASSHGLEQRRLDGVRLRAAGFTNFTQDHLDYHHDFDAYFAAKAGLFTRVLPDDGSAVVNMDDPKGVEIARLCHDRGLPVLGVGRGSVDLRITAQRFDATGQELRFDWQGKPRQVRLNLIGGFQADNVLLAAGLAIASGSKAERVFEALPALSTVRGRMQLVATRANGASVFVDYAHTPDAVATALRALRPHVLGRIIVVLGAGGDRDKAKRPLMGEAAHRYADVVYVTDDNPRSEDPAVIRAAVKGGAPEANEVGDRAEAILRAVDALQPGDALLIAGKGHETGQTIGDQSYPFDDAEQASIAVAALDGKRI